MKWHSLINLLVPRQSLPVRGAWIEIPAVEADAQAAGTVAPRAGSVD